MSTITTLFPIRREPELLGQTVVVIGGSAGIGLETARRAQRQRDPHTAAGGGRPRPAREAHRRGGSELA